MPQFAVENFNDVIDEIKPLLEAHYHEVAWYQDKIPFDPDYDKYKALEEAGCLHIVTARQLGKLVGYFVSMVLPGVHYRQNLFAMNDILYVDPSYRGGTVAYRMFKYAFARLKERGVDVVTIHMKTDAPFENLCKAVGMEKQEYLYSIYIGD